MNISQCPPFPPPPPSHHSEAWPARETQKSSFTFLFFEKTKIDRPRLEDGSLAPIALGGRVLSGMEQKAGLAVFFFYATDTRTRVSE